jgi:hypothetical protein
MRKILPILFALIGNTSLFSQSNPVNQALVYFVTGANRNPNGTSTITSQNILNVLSGLGIPTSNVVPAFPEFNASDTAIVYPESPNVVVGKDMNKTKIFKILCNDTTQRNQLVTNLQSLSEVLFAEANGKSNPLFVPNDSEFSTQWGLRNSTNPGKDIRAEQAWDIFRGSATNIIGIIDWGCDNNNPDLQSKIIGGDPGFATNPIEIHGFEVAGIAAAISNNSFGISGVDHFAKIYSKRIDYDNSSDVTINKAVNQAARYSPNLRVLIQSYASNKGYDVSNNPIPGRYSVTIRSAVATAYKLNKLSCFGSGNHNLYSLGQYANVVGYPAGFNTGALVAGATTISDATYFASARGQHLDIAAPGENINTLHGLGCCTSVSGTSFSAAFAGGLASLLVGYKPNLANDDIENIIKMTADDVNSSTLPGFDNQIGFGRINAQRALQFLQAPNVLQQLSVTGGTISNTSSSMTRIFLGVSNLADAAYLVKRSEVRANVTFPPMCSIVGVWGRGVGTTGYREDNGKNFGEGICEVVPGTLTNTGCTLRTWIYEVWTAAGQYIGFRPVTSANVVFQYTILGIPGQPTISGPNYFCSPTQQYTISGSLPPGLNVTWASSNTNIATVSGSGSSATVTKVANGNVTITATGGTCFSTSKPITVGSPAISFTATQSSCNGEYRQWNIVNNTPGNGSNWNWSVGVLNPNSDIIIYSPNAASTWVSVKGGGTVRLNYTDLCGVARQDGITVYSTCGGFFALAVSPNPAQDNIAVSINTPDESNATSSSATQSSSVRAIESKGKTILSLFEMNTGTLVKQWKYNEMNNQNYNLNINGLRKGVYALQADRDNHSVITKLIVE